MFTTNNDQDAIRAELDYRRSQLQTAALKKSEHEHRWHLSFPHRHRRHS